MMWKLKRFLKWDRISFNRTFGTAHHKTKDWTKGTWRSKCSADRRRPETFFKRLGHRAKKMRSLCFRFLKLVTFL